MWAAHNVELDLGWDCCVMCCLRWRLHRTQLHSVEIENKDNCVYIQGWCTSINNGTVQTSQYVLWKVPNMLLINKDYFSGLSTPILSTNHFGQVSFLRQQKSPVKSGISTSQSSLSKFDLSNRPKIVIETEEENDHSGANRLEVLSWLSW